MDRYNPKRKEKYQKTLRNNDSFIHSFQGQSEISYQIIKLFLEKDDNWEEVNDAQYLFNCYFYQME